MDALDRRVRQRQPQTLGDLRNFLVEERNRIPQQQIRTLINSMRRHCLAVRYSNGGHIDFEAKIRTTQDIRAFGTPPLKLS